MYDELIGNLRAQATHFHFNDETSLLLCQAADAIEDLSEKLDEETEYATALNSYVPQWIPATERLPEEEKTVLTWGKEHQCILLDWMHDNEWCCFGDADYWMPLPQSPEPPKESES